MLALGIYSRVRALIGDPDQNYATDAYLSPLIQQAIEDVAADLTNMDVGLDEQLIRLDGVPAGTPDLSTYQAAGKPLERMITPIWLEWKRAGDTDENYARVRPKDQVRNIANVDFISGWDWIGGVIEINPVTIAVDIRVRAQLLPPEVKDPNDVVGLPFGLTFCVSYKTARLVGIRRGNKTFIVEYGREYDRAIENVEEKFVKATQGRVRRGGRSIRQGSHFGETGPFPRFK